MPTYHLLNSYVAIGNSIDSLWNIFMGLHLVIFGAIYKYGVNITSKERAVFSVAYTVFAWMNCRALLFNYELIEATRIALVNSIALNVQEASELRSLMMTGNFTHRRETTWALHFSGALTVFSYMFYVVKK